MEITSMPCQSSSASERTSVEIPAAELAAARRAASTVSPGATREAKGWGPGRLGEYRTGRRRGARAARQAL
eukprot:13478259-Alexandrium_andersonii.AAC.1